MKTLWAIFILFALQAGVVLGNPITDFYFEHITIKDGLSQNYITCIHEDAKGFIWIGTKNGLNRYDGYKITEYNHSPSIPYSLCDNYIEALCRDSRGRLWVGTNNGLCRYREASDDFEPVDFSASPNDSPQSRHILSLYEDNDNMLWVGAASGTLYAIDLNGDDSLSCYPSSTPNMSIEDITRYKDTLYIGCVNNGLFGLDVSQKPVPGKTPAYKHLRRLSATAFLQDKQSGLWIGTGNRGYYQYKGFRNVLPGKAVLALCAYNDSTQLIGTEGDGIICYNPSTGSARNIGTSQRDINLNSDVITCFYVDSSGILWVGTTNGGINKYDPNKNHFHHISLLSENDPRSGMHSVYAICSLNRDALLVGLDAKGVCSFRRTAGTVGKDYVPGLHDTSINSLLKDSQGIVWLGTYRKSLKLDGAAGSVRQIEKLVGQYLSETATVKTMYEDHEHRIWIGTSNDGILCYDPGSRTLRSYGDNLDVYLRPNGIMSIYEDDEYQIWVGTACGLFRYSEAKDRFDPYFFPDKASPLSPYNTILPVCGVGDTLWMGTRQGLIGLSTRDRKAETFDRTDGLPSESIKGLLYDPVGNDLWLSTDKGLSRMNLAKRTFTNFGLKDGIVGCEFNDMSYWKDEDGYFYFGSVDGICCFHPQQIRTNMHLPRLAITNYRLYNRQIDDGTIEGMSVIPVTEHQVIEIPYHESIFSVDYVALNFTNSNKNQYAYKLEGYDKEWQYVGGQQMATYTNLNPGSYLFKVIASNNDGQWNEEPTSLEIIILPPWWRTPWAYALYILLLGGVIVASIRFYVARLQMKSQLANEQFEREQLKKLGQLKTQFFSNITHELRTPLTLIISPVERMIANKANIHTQQEYLKIIHNNAVKLLELVNQLLDFSKTDSGNFRFNPVAVNIALTVRSKVESFHLMAEQQNIRLSFLSQEPSVVCTADPAIIDKILYNLVSNAIKYTPENGKVDIELGIRQAEGESFLELSVTDTGKGIPQDKLSMVFDRFYQLEEDTSKGTGIGLSLVRNLVELHNGHIGLESEPGKGSRFTVRIPFVPVDRAVAVEEPLKEYTAEPTSGVKDRAGLLSATDDDECTYGDPVSAKRNKVLIAEDNTDLRHFIAGILSDKYTVIEADNGMEALDLARKEMPDLILSDILMPVMDGKQLCQQVKQDIQTCHIPFIMLTALTSEDNQIEGFTAGADDYITKPFHPEILLPKIKNVLLSRSLMYRRLTALSAMEPEQVEVEDKDSAFLLGVIQYIKANISNSDLKVDDISRESGMSRTPFFKKIKALTGLSPNDFIRDIRLNQAARMLTDSDMTISEVAYKVGFTSPKYFRECFKKQFGKSPSEYMERPEIAEK